MKAAKSNRTDTAVPPVSRHDDAGRASLRAAAAAALDAVKAERSQSDAAPSTTNNSKVETLDSSQMRFVLQPIVETNSGRVVFYECLMRVAKSDGGLEPAGARIESAERAGGARTMDLATLEMAIDILKQHDGVNLSLNISGLTCSDPAWLSRYLALTGPDAGLAKRLLIEITETAAMEDLGQSIAFVSKVQQQGSRVAIDDFGAGHTSFDSLERLNADVVKIDGSLVVDVGRSTSQREFLRSMVALAEACGMETVAEWIVDEDAVNFAKELGVTYLQGYYIGRPFDPAELS